MSLRLPSTGVKDIDLTNGNFLIIFRWVLFFTRTSDEWKIHSISRSVNYEKNKTLKCGSTFGIVQRVAPHYQFQNIQYIHLRIRSILTHRWKNSRDFRYKLFYFRFLNENKDFRQKKFASKKILSEPRKTTCTANLNYFSLCATLINIILLFHRNKC